MRTRRTSGPTRPREAGSTSVELAIGFPAVLVMLALVLALSSLGVARQGLCRAAGEAARAAVSGVEDPNEVGARALGALAARGASVSTLREGRWASARASLPARSIGGLSLTTASCEARAKIGSPVP